MVNTVHPDAASASRIAAAPTISLNPIIVSLSLIAPPGGGSAVPAPVRRLAALGDLQLVSPVGRLRRPARPAVVVGPGDRVAAEVEPEADHAAHELGAIAVDRVPAEAEAAVLPPALDSQGRGLEGPLDDGA